MITSSKYPAELCSKFNDEVHLSPIMSHQLKDTLWSEGPLDLSPSSTLSFTFPSCNGDYPLGTRSLSDSALVQPFTAEYPDLRRTESTAELSPSRSPPTEEEFFRHYNLFFNYYQMSCVITNDHLSNELENFNCPARFLNDLQPYSVSAPPSGRFDKLKVKRRDPKAMTGRHIQEGPGASHTILKILRMKIQKRIESKMRKSSAVAINLSNRLPVLEKSR